MNADKLAERIVKEVGGKNNIKEMFHCVTRLRFYLKDRSVVDEERIKKLDGVLGVQFATDQLQIIIGNEVGTVYNAIINKVGFIMDDATAEKKKKMRIGGIFETISAIILPVIPAMAGTGILKGSGQVLCRKSALFISVTEHLSRNQNGKIRVTGSQCHGNAGCHRCGNQCAGTLCHA